MLFAAARRTGTLAAKTHMRDLRDLNVAALNLLRAIRDGEITSRSQLKMTQVFTPGIPETVTDHERIAVLDQLIDSRLVEEVDERLMAAKSLENIQALLGVSLQFLEFVSKERITLDRVKELMGWYELRRTNLLVKPLFGYPSRNTYASDVFVASPFGSPFDELYSDHISKVAKKLKLRITRADDFFTTHAIMNDVWYAILHSKCVIADCTNKNPNVFYEIGMAHAIGRTVVLITQSLDHVPFDIKHLRCIVYEYTPRAIKDFETTLSETLSNALEAAGASSS
jgi:hypothetical protein